MQNTLMDLENSGNSTKSVVWIVSYPKSGNTWVQTVVRQIGKKYGFPPHDLDVYKMMRDKREPTFVRGINKDIAVGDTTVLKTHSRHTPNNSIHSNLNLKTVGFIYVVRNPLDILLSYINFTRIQYSNNKENQVYQKKLFIDLLGFEQVIPYEKWLLMDLDKIPKENLDNALKYFIERDTSIPNMEWAGSSWKEHVISWRDASKKIPSVFLRYEDLLRDSEYFLPIQKLFSFSNTEIVGAANSVNEWTISQAENKKESSIFFNKMTSFYYTNYFSENLIDKFIKTFEEELRFSGYDDMPN